MLKYFLLWFPMLVLAILNGALREYFFKRYMSNLPAHQLSTLTLMILFGTYSLLVFRWLPVQTGRQALLTGLLWLLMTVIFEFGFGRLRGNSWHSLLADYNLFKGRLWILIPLWVGVLPFLVYRFCERTNN